MLVLTNADRRQRGTGKHLEFTQDKFSCTRQRRESVVKPTLTDDNDVQENLDK